MRLFDSHAHYGDGRFDADREEVLASMKAAGVERIVEIGCDLPGAQNAVRLAHAHPFLYAAVGVHPQEADGASDADFDALEALCRDEKVVAVGEIGLDYHYENAPRAVQKEVFARQLELARRLDLPVCIHDREAHADTLDVLRAYPGVRGVFHSYSGSLEMTRDVLRLGFIFGFNGIITFKNAKKFEPIIKSLPEASILLETDCPYLAPEPFRGRRHDSRWLYRACETVAELRGIPDEDAAELTYANAARFYGLS